VPELHPSAGPRVLLVEDDAAIRDTLTELLRDEGCAVTPVSHGREALTQLRRSALPDVIVLDLMMPVMDGWEFRVEQRADPVLSRIPVIAMSADVSAKARAIAADAYVRKPIDFADLFGRIRSVVGHATRQRLAAADRMAALGTLASGFAHEINNPLTYVAANLQVLRDRLPALLNAHAAAEVRELLDDTIDGAERIRRIVKHAQMVAPVQPEERETVVDLRAALEAALTLAANEIRHRARLVREMSGNPCVRGDRGRVEQLFLNLLLNAAQAIAEGHAANNEIRVSLRASPPGRALVEIADSGCGIPAEVQERVFQPFFTTKPVGQGTGLGLSICHGIVSALGGEISFESAPGSGTVFHVIIPTVVAPPVEAAGPAAAAVAAEARRRVLVVDDETSILRAVRQILEPTHEVTTATDGEAALALARSGRNFDVILCDVMLSAKNGTDLLDELERTHPELARRVVFMTAGAFTPRTRQVLERRPSVAKPFDRDQLMAAVAGEPR
jgi:signal transduction histidine kinase